jgi:hypothetical protein
VVLKLGHFETLDQKYQESLKSSVQDGEDQWDFVVKYDEVLHGVKGKGVPLQVWSGPEGSRKLRFPDFMTTAHDG